MQSTWPVMVFTLAAALVSGTTGYYKIELNEDVRYFSKYSNTSPDKLLLANGNFPYVGHGQNS